MKLVHPDIKNQIIFSENKVNVLTIENKTFFTEFVSEFLVNIQVMRANSYYQKIIKSFLYQKHVS